MRRAVWLLSLVTALGVCRYGFAQDDAEDEESPVAASEEGEASPEASAGDDAAAAPDAATKAAAAASGVTPTWWVGPYIEGIIVPSFMLKLFLDASPTVFTPSFGVTVTHRNADGFSWVLGLGYASYGFDGPFRASGDPEEDTEYLDSSIGLLHARGMLLWSSEIAHNLSFEYGVGIELGVVLGELKRSEAFKDTAGKYHACNGPGDPISPYCEPTVSGMHTDPYNSEGAHYGVVEKRVPPVAAALMIPALALRFTPIEKLAIKVEAAFGLLQFTFGLSAAYAIGG